jgi:hypothetical protein
VFWARPAALSVCPFPPWAPPSGHGVPSPPPPEASGAADGIYWEEGGGQLSSISSKDRTAGQQEASSSYLAGLGLLPGEAGGAGRSLSPWFWRGGGDTLRVTFLAKAAGRGNPCVHLGLNGGLRAVSPGPGRRGGAWAQPSPSPSPPKARGAVCFPSWGRGGSALVAVRSLLTANERRPPLSGVRGRGDRFPHALFLRKIFPDTVTHKSGGPGIWRRE